MESRRRAQAADCEPSEDQACISQASYCRGYSGEDPPLPIPNREVKLTIADGTDPPVGRVGSRGSSKPRASRDARGFFYAAGCCCSAGSKVRKRSGIVGLTSQLLLLRAVRLVTSADNARHAASRHRPLRGPPHMPPSQARAHFRFRTRARTAAATRFLRPFGQFHFRCRRGFPPV